MPADDPRIADLVRAGRVRAAVFPSFLYAREPATGELTGLAILLARELAAALGIVGEVVEFPHPPAALRALAAGECDIAFLGIDPGRAGEVDFSPPYLRADFTFLVPPGSQVRSLAEVDQPGTRVAVVSGHAMEIALRGQLARARPVYAATPDAAFALLRAGEADVLAGIRPGLLAYGATLPGARVLDLRYGENLLAIAVAKGQAGRLAYVREFVEAAKTCGLVQRIIARAGLAGVDVPAA
jgi:polar amino acid transport system substrate-binding protein